VQLLLGNSVPYGTWQKAKGEMQNLVTAGSAAQQSRSSDFSKGITGYQPLSEGALYMRLALLPAEGIGG